MPISNLYTLHFGLYTFIHMQYIFILYPLILGGLFLFSPKRRGIKVILNIIKTLGSVVLVLALLRVYCFDIYNIPSASMKQTIDVGDRIIIRKNGFPERNDMVVFKSMNVKDLILVKRCVGLPGDTLEIVHNTVICNGQQLEEPKSLQWSYSCDSLNLKEMSSILKRSLRGKKKDLLLTSAEANLLNTSLPYLHLRKNCKPDRKRDKVFPRDKLISNNRDNFSSFIVPAKGLTMKLDSITALWYRKYIKIENASAEVDNGGLITLNGDTTHQYTFQNDYYYVMGDNRHRSFDSRYFGFISASNIKGKVIYIWSKHN